MRNRINMHQCIRFGKISRYTSLCDRHRHYNKILHAAHFSVKMAADVYYVVPLKTCFLHVIFMHHHHAPFVMDATIAIVHTIYSGVKLVVASYCHHDVFAGLRLLLFMGKALKCALPVTVLNTRCFAALGK